MKIKNSSTTLAAVAITLIISGCGKDDGGNNPAPIKKGKPEVLKCAPGKYYYKEFSVPGGMHVIKVHGENTCNDFRLYSSEPTDETWQMYHPDRLPELPDNVEYLYSEYARDPNAGVVLYQRDYAEKTENGVKSPVLAWLNEYDPNGDLIRATYAFCGEEQCETKIIDSDNPKYRDFFADFRFKEYREQMNDFLKVAKKVD